MPSERLIALLRYAKAEDPDMTWRAVAAALGDIYHPKMSLADAVHHLAAAHQELLAEPRFAVQSGSNALDSLLLAPIKGYCSIELFGPKSTDQTYSVESIYNSFTAHILGELRWAKVDWCAELIAAPEKPPAPAAPPRPLCRDCADEVVRQQTPKPVCPNSGQPCGF